MHPQNDQKPAPPRLTHFVVYGIVTGLIVFGAVSLLTWILYGSPVITDHVFSSAMLAALVVLAGLLANPALTLLRNAGAIRYTTDRDAADPAAQRVEIETGATYAPASNGATAARQRRLSQGRTHQR